ncbi:MAG TPA: hypothetical protein VMX14_00545 [Anaerolineae bacterium]|nr:hypothetical protein [Anaerolineae bacterium]
MRRSRGRIDVRPKRLVNRIRQALVLDPSWRFARDVTRLIWDHRAYSLAILAVTVVQELAALWPVSLLGQLVDRLQSGDVGNTVWLLLGASLLYPAVVRGNVILRHKMLYETDFEKRVELTLRVSARGDSTDIEAASAAHTRVLNAVGGIVSATYHLLGDFTPVIVKVVVVSGSLLAYNRLIGLAYLASLGIPALLTVLFNSKLRVLRDAQYSVMSEASGAGVRVISEKGQATTQQRFKDVMRERKAVLVALVRKSQLFLCGREVTLVGSQFLVVFLALSMRSKIGLTPGDFTKIVGYTGQVAAAFIGAASVVDAIISHMRAYHVYARVHGI